MRRATAIVATLLSLSRVALAAEPQEPKATTRLEARINGEKWTGDLDGIAKRRMLRILVVPTALGFFFNGSQMQGAMYDMGRELEEELNKKLKTGHLAIGAVFIPVAREETRQARRGIWHRRRHTDRPARAAGRAGRLHDPARPGSCRSGGDRSGGCADREARRPFGTGGLRAGE
jgi:hypothetical protein